MLTPDILNALKAYSDKIKKPVSFVVQTGDHEKRDELVDMLNQLSTISDHLQVIERDAADILRSPVSFYLEADGQPTGIIFSGVPGGHEFNSLVLTMLHAGGHDLKLDSGIVSKISKINAELKFEVFVSLSCHNCPDVVQALNQFAIINPNISVETIDGGLYPDLIAERNIQGVPSVYLNQESFANGKIDTAQLFDKLAEGYPEIMQDSGDTEKLPLQDVTIIGGGPAGVAAAVYSARKGLKVTMVADRFGGQVKDTMGIENYIGMTETTGPKLTGDLKTHLETYNITLKEHLRVNQINKTDTNKVLELSSGETIDSKTVIVATGANWRELGVLGERENIGNGVAYCPHCDGPFFKGKDVAVIGGGNSGVEAALDLSGIVKSVTVIEFAPELKADQILIDQMDKRNNITVIKNAATQEIFADNGKVVALTYQDRATQETHEVTLSGVFVQIGLVPNSQFLKDTIELSKYGEVIINERGETSEPGIFACGDVTTVPYKQIIIAAGEGSKASLAAFDYLMRQ